MNNQKDKDISGTGVGPLSINQLCGYSGDNECLYNRVMNITSYLVIAVDKAGIVKFINPQVSRLTGMDSDFIIGKKMVDIMTLFHGEKPGDEIELGLALKKCWQGDIEIISGDGSQRLVRFDVTRGEDEEYFDIYIGSDITDGIREVRLKSQEARNSTRSELAGEISHELNNFLSIAMGNLELLGMAIEKGKSDNLDKRVKSVREGLTRMAKFVEGLMSISRQEQHIEKIDLNQFLDSEILYLQAEPGFENIEITRQWDHTIPEVEVDKGRLQQVFYNIMLNARDAVEKRDEKRIEVVTSLSEADGYIRMSISDNGRGLSEDDYSKVYRQNFTTKGPGHGFGLLSVKGMIKSQGGRVAVGPSPEGGACFTLELPGKKDTAAAKLASMPAL